MMRFGVHRQHGRKRIAALAASCVVVAVALLGVAIYSLVSYLKERRASQLPVHKKKK